MEKIVVKYKLVASDSAMDMNSEVNKLLGEGWSMLGHTLIDNTAPTVGMSRTVYAQTMVKYESV